MRAVGIKELNNNLSRYLRYVRAGETLRVKDRDEIIAEIHQPRGEAPGKRSQLEAWMEEQERAGKIRRAQTAGPSLHETWRAAAASGEAFDLSSVLDQIKGDRI